MNGIALGVLAAGIGSALLYGARRKLVDAALALVAGAALAALVALPPAAKQQAAVTLDTSHRGDAFTAALLEVRDARHVLVKGDGLRDAEWRDLPARPVTWRPPAADVLSLDFARTATAGRTFAVTVARSAPQRGWRLQLLAENGQVLDEAAARNAEARLAVHWQPPLAETLVLRARVLDAKGGVVAEGPVPVRVVEPVPLQAVGRFAAPSFDARALNALLAGSGAQLDWQTVLGKGVTRTEAPAAPLVSPNVVIADAAWVERHGARPALPAGVPLLVLGGSARDAATWRALGLPLAMAEGDTVHVEKLELSAAPLRPSGWAVLGRDADGKPWLWQRDWQGRRVLWLGVADWHRHAIAAPAALAHWWQQVLDHAAPTSVQVTWELPDPMPVPGLRSEVCADGVRAGDELTIDTQRLRWLARTEHGGAACAAWRPARPGWHTVRSGAAVTQVYVFAAQDWPMWQAGLRREATLRHAARALPGYTPAAVSGPRTMPAWPCGVLAACALLALWWRERR